MVFSRSSEAGLAVALPSTTASTTPSSSPLSAANLAAGREDGAARGRGSAHAGENAVSGNASTRVNCGLSGKAETETKRPNTIFIVDTEKVSCCVWDKHNSISELL